MRFVSVGFAVALLVEYDSKRFEPIADLRAHGMRIFADPAAENNCVGSAEYRQVSPDIFADAVAKHLQCERGTFALCGAGFKLAQIVRAA